MASPSTAPEARAAAPARLNMEGRVRPSLAGFEPYDPAFTPTRINLSANENTHDLPEGALRAIGAALAATPVNRYPDPLSNELRDELACAYGLSRENVMVGNGGDELLFNLLYAFGGGARALVTCPPDFSEYENFAAMTETEHVPVWRRQDFSLDGEALLAAAQDAALVFLCSPNNPTGDLADLRLVDELCSSTDALVLVDEAYGEFAGQDASAVPLMARHPNLMVLKTFSKAYALAGARCGYLLADRAVVAQLSAVRQIYSVNVLTQAAALAAFRCRRAFEPVVEDIRRERDRLEAGLAGLAGRGLLEFWPSKANFVLVRMERAAEVRRALRDDYSILVRDFSAAPGLAGCLRLTVGTAEENDELLRALEAELEKGRCRS